MTFTLLIFYWNSMANHSKHEALETFRMPSEKYYYFIFKDPSPILQLFTTLMKIVSWQFPCLTEGLEEQLSFKDDEVFQRAKSDLAQSSLPKL